MSWTVSRLKIRLPLSSPPLRRQRAKRERSAAVVKRPAWPVTPPILREVGSCTTPRSTASPTFSVGATRGWRAGAGVKEVSFMPRGPKISVAVN